MEASGPMSSRNGRPTAASGHGSSSPMSDRRSELIVAPSARRQPSEELPEAVAFAAFEFIVGPLLDNPQRVGKRLRPPLKDRHSARRGTYRVF